MLRRSGLYRVVVSNLDWLLQQRLIQAELAHDTARQIPVLLVGDGVDRFQHLCGGVGFGAVNRNVDGRYGSQQRKLAVIGRDLDRRDDVAPREGRVCRVQRVVSRGDTGDGIGLNLVDQPGAGLVLRVVDDGDRRVLDLGGQHIGKGNHQEDGADGDEQQGAGVPQDVQELLARQRDHMAKIHQDTPSA